MREFRDKYGDKLQIEGVENPANIYLTAETGKDGDAVFSELEFSPAQARQIAAYLNECADRIEDSSKTEHAHKRPDRFHGTDDDFSD